MKNIYIQKALKKAGIVSQKKKRRIAAIKKAVYWSNTNIHIIALPSDEYRVSYILHYPQANILRSQYCTFNISEENYDNLAEFVLDNFNKIPGKNESFIFENKAEFSIANISSQRIKSIRLKLFNHSLED